MFTIFNNYCMRIFKLLLIIVTTLNLSCENNPRENNKIILPKTTKKAKDQPIIVEKAFVLNDQNSIPFLFDYGKNNLEKKIRITTHYENIYI